MNLDTGGTGLTISAADSLWQRIELITPDVLEAKVERKDVAGETPLYLLRLDYGDVELDVTGPSIDGLVENLMAGIEELIVEEELTAAELEAGRAGILQLVTAVGHFPDTIAPVIIRRLEERRRDLVRDVDGLPETAETLAIENQIEALDFELGLFRAFDAFNRRVLKAKATADAARPNIGASPAAERARVEVERQEREAARIAAAKNGADA